LNLSEKLRRGSAFEVFKGKRSEVALKKEGHGEQTFIHFAEVLEERVRTVGILCGESPKQ
jgi:hypothetical protein